VLEPQPDGEYPDSDLGILQSLHTVCFVYIKPRPPALRTFTLTCLILPVMPYSVDL
jgi:hypothetical protein